MRYICKNDRDFADVCRVKSVLIVLNFNCLIIIICYSCIVGTKANFNLYCNHNGKWSPPYQDKCHSTYILKYFLKMPILRSINGDSLTCMCSLKLADCKSQSFSVGRLQWVQNI